MEKLIKFISRYAQLSPAAIAGLKCFAEEEKSKKNVLILNAGQVCHKIWFLTSGMVRKYQLQDGKERTCWIHFENEIFTSLDSYFSQTPSKDIIEACEESEIISISKEASKELARFPEFLSFTNALMGEQFASIDRVSKEFSFMDAKQRYNYLQKVSPKLFQKAKLGHIASIMGITQETLSRIRSKE
ncbi:MAG: Crp/Fnr family transcriptional regulator [Bacteroidales bacterium]|nr:Crp/Fnr family transcriptional regulator [Bacteroidales bacterium]MBN2818932.1 Crp/Fnr family transcriptional regulator [Bacteroidales bacterium]